MPRVVCLLGRSLQFPSAEAADDNGMVAIGGDFSLERLRLAYREGIFPWPVSEDWPVTWFSPDPRAVLELDELHISRSLRKLMRQTPYLITRDRAFPQVIDACAALSEQRSSTWITPQLRAGYLRLYEAGLAHSVECWRGDRLVGGLYGVRTGGVFSGESMFSFAPSASKLALVHLVEHLGSRGFTLIDVQELTPHLISLGAKGIPRRDFLRRLRESRDAQCRF